MGGVGKDRDERVALLSATVGEGEGSRPEEVQRLVSPTELDRERYAERQSWSLLVLALVFGGGSLMALLLFGDTDPVFWLLALVALVGAAFWWRRSQVPDD